MHELEFTTLNSESDNFELLQLLSYCLRDTFKRLDLYNFCFDIRMPLSFDMI